MIDIISELTRIAFQESFVHNSTLTKISGYFNEAGVTLGNIPENRTIYGERRILVEKYYCSVDWKSPSDVQKVLKAYEEYLKDLYRKDISNEMQKLIKRLEDDGLRYRGGKIEIVAPIGFESSRLEMTVTELNDMRTKMIRIMDYLVNGKKFNDIPLAVRVNELRKQGIIPSNIANLMQTIIRFRNDAEYQQYQLTQNDIRVVNNAWSSIIEWARGKGWV